MYIVSLIMAILMLNDPLGAALPLQVWRLAGDSVGADAELAWQRDQRRAFPDATRFAIVAG